MGLMTRDECITAMIGRNIKDGGNNPQFILDAAHATNVFTDYLRNDASGVSRRSRAGELTQQTIKFFQAQLEQGPSYAPQAPSYGRPELAM